MGVSPADRASLLGVPVRSLHTIVWSIAGVLAFLALFLRAGIIGLPIGSALSFGVLLRALAALMLGRMTHLPTIVASSVVIGVLEMGVDWNGFLGQRSPLRAERAVAVDDRSAAAIGEDEVIMRGQFAEGVARVDGCECGRGVNIPEDGHKAAGVQHGLFKQRVIDADAARLDEHIGGRGGGFHLPRGFALGGVVDDDTGP